MREHYYNTSYSAVCVGILYETITQNTHTPGLAYIYTYTVYSVLDGAAYGRVFNV